MQKKLYKLASVILILIMVVTTFVTVASAETGSSAYVITIDDIVNPLSRGVEESKLSSFSISSKKYYSAPDLESDVYTDDEEEVVNDIRAAMVRREPTLDIYYKTTDSTIRNKINTVFLNWIDRVISETENSDEGDYLRWVYEHIGTVDDQVYYSTDGQYYYYHFPLEFIYYTTRAQEDALDAKIDEVIESFDFDAFSTPKQKTDTIYKFITKNVTYDYDNLNISSYKLKYTAYAALINGTAVCQGYATLFYRLAKECGLETRVITGKSRNQNHAWNIVKIGSYYYYLDSTWDAGEEEVNYQYYLKGSDSFVPSHTPEERYTTSEFKQKYPISATDMNLTDDGLSDDFEYYTYMDEAYITAYNGNDAHVIVPAQIGGYPVHSVEGSTFSNMLNIQSITFSEGIKRMGFCAIECCENLKQINFPSTMKLVYEKNTDLAKSGYTEVPMYCYNLEKVTVANGNPYMKLVDGILYSADGKSVILCVPKYNKTKVIILEGVEDIAPNAFYGCENIEEIIMPDTVKMIGYWAFCNSNNLKKVNISKNCEFIGQFAFYSTAVTSIHIPASMKTILGGAFGTDLTEITVDSENENFYMQNGALISYNAEFNNRTILKYDIDNPATVFTVPDNVLEIEQYAFLNAKNLEKVIVPDNVEYIWHYAFENCDSLTHFEFPEGIETVNDGVLVDCDNIMSVIIPDSVTTIGDMLVNGNDGYTIYGEKGGVAEQYANTNSIKFKETSEFVCTNGHTVQKKFVDEYTYYNVCTVCGDRAITKYLNVIEPLAYVAKVEYEYYSYTGKAIKPKIAQFEGANGEPMVEGVDYKILGYYENINAGYGYIEVQGIGNYAGKGQIPFEIKPIHISKKTIGIEYLSTNYDGGEKQPIIKIEGLDEFEDFSVEYSNNIYPGTAKAKITAWGNYEGTVTVNFEIKLPATKKVTTTLYGHNDVKVSWNKVMGATGYLVYYKKSSAKSYTYKGSTTALSYNFANLSSNTKYDFKVVAYCLKGKTKITSSYYKTASATTLRNLKAPSKVTLSLYGYDDVKISWSKVSYAKGYYVYYKKSSAKSFTYIGKTTGTSFKKANLSDGVKYTFKVVPYGVSGSKIILDDNYKTASVYTLKKISTPKITKSSSKKVKVSWTNINGESGYQISQSTSKSKTKIVSTYTTTSGKSKTIKATKKKTYYYKVRAFVKVGKKVYYGPWSTVKSYKLK
ncbi:MAG: leucine-rich repeat protein [Clostridia bacterium]|nr:leucine-rich repeat protein [Clostridia bacterium]